jgi:hypothetical protein
MNRRYVIAGAAVVGVVGLWHMFGQSGSGGGAQGTTAASSGIPQATTPAPAVSAIPTAQLYGSATATGPSQTSGTLSSLSAFGKPRDGFVQIVSNASPSNSNSLSFGRSPTTTAPISLGSGPTTAVSSGATGTPATVPSSPGTTTAPPVQTLAAELDVGGVPVVALVGDAIPPDTKQFTVRSITTSQVVLALHGALLANGAASVTIKVGKSLTVENQTAHTSVVVHLLSVHPA